MGGARHRVGISQLSAPSAVLPTLGRGYKCSVALRLGYTGPPASDTSARIASRLRFQIVGFFVHDHRMADDRGLAIQLEHLVGHLEMRFAGSVGFDIAEITFVAIRHLRARVLVHTGAI